MATKILKNNPFSIIPRFSTFDLTILRDNTYNANPVVFTLFILAFGLFAYLILLVYQNYSLLNAISKI